MLFGNNPSNESLSLGNTAPFEGVILGSNPSGVAKHHARNSGLVTVVYFSGHARRAARLSNRHFMEETTFFKHYRICVNEDGSPNEVGRTGAATNYKAIDTRSKEPVTLQLIPLAIVDRTKRKQFKERARTAQKLDHVNIAKVLAVGVEHDYFGLVSEYLEGETVDSWVVAHGPMPADAVLRIGLQVVRAVAAAAFFGLTHRAIQPSNLMIVPGQSPDGGWPFVKLLNFGLAGLELHSEGTVARSRG